MQDHDALVSTLSRAIESCSVHESEAALRTLIVSHPNSWRASLARLGALPNPSRSDLSTETFAERCQTLSSVADALASAGTATLEQILWLQSLAIETTRASHTFRILKQFLMKLNFFTDCVPN